MNFKNEISDNLQNYFLKYLKKINLNRKLKNNTV